MRIRSTTTRDRTDDELTRSGPDDLAEARRGRDVLLAAARTLVEAIDHDPDVADCVEAGCSLAAAGSERCSLVHRLAGLQETATRASGVGEALAAFDLALAGAVDAVRRCRQTEHGTGRCWFSSGAGIDGCGEVLRAAHRLG